MENGDNTLVRTAPCPRCGGAVLWTQAAWPEPTPDHPDLTRAAYRCVNGHAIDPAETPQCPHCGVHDTALLGPADAAADAGEARDEGPGGAPSRFVCRRCDTHFTVPR